MGSSRSAPESRELQQWLVDLERRAEHLKTLKPNWDSYGGEAPNHEAVDKAVELAAALALYFPDYPPQLVPCQDGVQVEWHTMGYDVEMWISRSTTGDSGALPDSQVAACPPHEEGLNG